MRGAGATRGAAAWTSTAPVGRPRYHGRVRWSLQVARRVVGLVALLVAAPGCLPAPTPQHAVWRSGYEYGGQVAPVPAVAPKIDEGGELGVGPNWPGLIGGRGGYATSRVRATVGAFVGMSVYGDASLAVRLVSSGRVHAAVAVEGGSAMRR